MVIPAEGDRVQVQCDSAGKAVLLAWLEKHPLKLQQGVVVSSVLRWFVAQDDAVKNMILQSDATAPAARAAFLRLLADQIVQEPGTGLPAKVHTGGKSAGKTLAGTK